MMIVAGLVALAACWWLIRSAKPDANGHKAPFFANRLVGETSALVAVMLLTIGAALTVYGVIELIGI